MHVRRARYLCSLVCSGRALVRRSLHSPGDEREGRLPLRTGEPVRRRKRVGCLPKEKHSPRAARDAIACRRRSVRSCRTAAIATYTRPDDLVPCARVRVTAGCRSPIHNTRIAFLCDATEAALPLDDRAAVRAGFSRYRFEVESAHHAAGSSPAYDLAGHDRGAGGTQVTVVDEGVGSQRTKGRKKVQTRNAALVAFLKQGSLGDRRRCARRM